MLKKLQRKFLNVISFLVSVIILLIIISISVISAIQITQDADRKLNYIINDIYLDPDSWKDFQNDVEMQYRLRFFDVVLDRDGNIVHINTNHVVSVSDEEAAVYVLRAISGIKQSGYVDKFRYMRYSAGDYSGIAFLDVAEELRLLLHFIMLAFVSGAVVGGIIIFIFHAMSKKAITPFAESFEKQRRFISDASHEIKTPIAIISANAEVIEMTSGKSEWTTSILHQAERLSELVKNLLTIAKMDEESSQFAVCSFDLSSVFAEECDNFRILAESKGKNLEYSMRENLTYSGNEESIRQLIGILADNAIKYSSEGSDIKMSLTTSGKNTDITCENLVDDAERLRPERFFDRFYRDDDSRAGGDGYGIGLSIAKSIVEAHKGRITAKARGGKIIVRASL